MGFRIRAASSSGKMAEGCPFPVSVCTRDRRGFHDAILQRKESCGQHAVRATDPMPSVSTTSVTRFDCTTGRFRPYAERLLRAVTIFPTPISWQIEVFFKQIKQSLQLCDFLGNSANAVRWQVWTALLLCVLMRFLCVISRWNHSFTRLFTLLRAALWRKIDLWDLLRFCGTAGGHFRYLATPQNAYLPGFAK
jgi:hypothetical protein